MILVKLFKIRKYPSPKFYRITIWSIHGFQILWSSMISNDTMANATYLCLSMEKKWYLISILITCFIIEVSMGDWMRNCFWLECLSSFICILIMPVITWFNSLVCSFSCNDNITTHAATEETHHITTLSSWHSTNSEQSVPNWISLKSMSEYMDAESCTAQEILHSTCSIYY